MYAQGSPNQGKLIETVKPDGTKIYELKESPAQLPMEGVDPEIEKHVQRLSQHHHMHQIGNYAQVFSEPEEKPKPKPLGWKPH